jgi:L-seryl-tRNA(Ser) seleniumtransferase
MQTETDSQTNPTEEYRKLPSVNVLLRLPALSTLIEKDGQQTVIQAIRASLEQARRAIAGGERAPKLDTWPLTIAAQIEALSSPTLRPVINATGVIIHTNLGRAPLSAQACEAVNAISHGYSNLEYELDAGQRGSRHDHARQRLCALTGAEDAMVVNNNAAAVYLVLTALAADRDVIVSRGQLVEIGGGFRIPDVLRQSGCRLVEVGTTNRTHLHDFAAAISDETGAIMHIHSSNFLQLGFVSQPHLSELADVAHSRHQEWGDPVLLIDDLGSGTLLETSAYGLAPEPTVQESLSAGVDIVTFSGDKLLGGPQAGIVVGRSTLIERLRSHPMARALRVDKMVLAALDATLRSYQRHRAVEEVPVWRMISTPLSSLEQRVASWREALAEAEITSMAWDGASAIGGGSLPGETVPTKLLALPVESPDSCATALRALEVPVICRIQSDHLLFDPRTLLPEHDALLVTAIIETLK